MSTSKRIRVTILAADKVVDAPSERTIEVIDPETGRGCLVSFSRTEDGLIKITPFCYDASPAGIIVEKVTRR